MQLDDTLTEIFQYQFIDTDNMTLWHQRKNVQFTKSWELLSWTCSHFL